MTPDPSIAPVAVWVTGYAPQGDDLARMVLVVLVVGFGLIAFTLAAIAALAGFRR